MCEKVEITEEMVNKQWRKISSWKGPGIDNVQGYWLKTQLTSVYISQCSFMISLMKQNFNRLDDLWKDIAMLKGPYKG